MGETIPDDARALLVALTTLYGEDEVIETALSFPGLNKAAKSALKKPQNLT